MFVPVYYTMRKYSIIGALAVLCAVLCLAAPVADVSAADTAATDTGVTVTVANTDDGVAVTFEVPADYSGAADLGDIVAYNGTLAYNEGKTVENLTSDLAAYVSADGTTVTVSRLGDEALFDALVSEDGILASVSWDTVTVVCTIADAGHIYTAEEIAAIQDAASAAATAAVTASYSGYMSPDDVQAAVDAAVAEALAGVPADRDSTVFGLDIPTFAVIVIMILLVAAGLGIFAWKSGVFKKEDKN